MSNLGEAIREGLDQIERNPFHALPLPVRRQLWRALGPSEHGPEERAHGSGLIRRTSLAIDAVQHVIPIWEAAFPKKAGPDEMTSLARGILEGKYGVEVKQRSERFQVYSENLGYESGNEVAALVGTAASKLIPLALYDAYWGESATEQDKDLDPDLWDPSYVASIAAANGPFGDPRSKNNARRAFWQWYVREAAPKAYKTASDNIE